MPVYTEGSSVGMPVYTEGSSVGMHVYTESSSIRIQVYTGGPLPMRSQVSAGQGHEQPDLGSLVLTSCQQLILKRHHDISMK